MSNIKATEEFEKYRLTVEPGEGCSSQLVSHPISGTNTWQVWQRRRNLGEGTFGRVWQEAWEDKHGDFHYRAVKSCSEAKMQAARIDYKRELSALAAFSKSECASWFVNLHGWWMESGDLCIAMEYLGRGDLSRYATDGIPELEIKEIAENVLQGLEVMHREGFTHRDIKPQNILVFQKRPEFQRWWVKIADFGISKQILANSETFLHTSVGTRPYCAPEILGYLEQETSVYSSKVDMWSFGCVLFNLGSRGHIAFSEIDLARYCDGRVQFNPQNCPIYMSGDGKALMKTLLQARPEQRPSAAEVLKDSWFSMREISTSDDIRPGLSLQRSNQQNFNSFLGTDLSSSLSPKVNSPELALRPVLKAVPQQAAENSQHVQDMEVKSLYTAQPLPINVPETGTISKQGGALDSTRATIPKNGLSGFGPVQFEYDADTKWSGPSDGQKTISEVQRSEHDRLSLWLEANTLRIKHENQIGGTALHLAASEGRPEIVMRLVERGAEINSKNNGGWTPLHCAADEGHIEVVKWLAEKAANLNSKHNGGWTPLHFAASKGNLEVVKWLGEKGADLNSKSKSGWTPLHFAAREGNLEVVKWLGETGAELDSKSDSGWTLLHCAASEGRLEVVKWLGEKGANLDAKDNSGRTAQQVAKSRSQSEVLKWLKEQKPTADISTWEKLFSKRLK